MKIRKITKYKSKLIDFKLITTKIFNKKNLLRKNTTLEEIKYQLKKSLQIIYKYHINNKNILFIGNFSNNFINFKKANHTWFNNIKWINGILTNKNSNFIKQSIIKHDLVVIFNNKLQKDSIYEAYLSKIPTICLNINFNIRDTKCLFKVPGEYRFNEKPLRNDFFFSILEATLKRANYFKNKQKYAFNKKK